MGFSIILSFQIIEVQQRLCEIADCRKLEIGKSGFTFLNISLMCFVYNLSTVAHLILKYSYHIIC
jgi:hypothetical protein